MIHKSSNNTSTIHNYSLLFIILCCSPFSSLLSTKNKTNLCSLCHHNHHLTNPITTCCNKVQPSLRELTQSLAGWGNLDNLNKQEQQVIVQATFNSLKNYLSNPRHKLSLDNKEKIHELTFTFGLGALENYRNQRSWNKPHQNKCRSTRIILT